MLITKEKERGSIFVDIETLSGVFYLDWKIISKLLLCGNSVVTVKPLKEIKSKQNFIAWLFHKSEYLNLKQRAFISRKPPTYSTVNAQKNLSTFQ